MLTLKVLSAAALVGAIAWFIHNPGYEPAVASITALSAYIATFVTDLKRRRTASMHQFVGSRAVGIQAGRNVTTGNVETKITDNYDAQ